MKLKRLILYLFLSVSLNNLCASGFYSATDYGIKRDGQTVNTKAINAAIEEIAAKGGGTLFFPAGDYLTCTITLKSNITLYLDNGATIIAAKGTQEDGYGLPEQPLISPYQDFGHSHWSNSLIYGRDLVNVAIIGQGTIWGRHLVPAFDQNNKNLSEKYFRSAGDKAIGLVNCKGVTIKDISIIKGGWFALLTTGVDNLTLDNIKVDTNRDGFDIDCCQNVRLSNCSFNVPKDDAIVLKSSYALGYNRSTENIMITNCHVSAKFGSVFRGDSILTNTRDLGGIKFGTESNGGFKNITVSNCTLDSSVGILIESVDGAQVENITFSNIVMRDVNKTPLFIRTCARMRAPQGSSIGYCRRILFNNIVAYNVKRYGDKGKLMACPAMIMGIPGSPVEDVELSNIKFYFNTSGTKEMITKPVGEQLKDYPDPGMWGGNMPAYGFYIRHAKNIRLSNVSLFCDGKEERPALFIDDVQNISLNNMEIQKNTETPFIILKNIKDFKLSQVKGIKDTESDSIDVESIFR